MRPRGRAVKRRRGGAPPQRASSGPAVPVERPQKGDLELSEILANTATMFKNLLQRSGHRRRKGIKFKILMKARHQLECSVQEEPSRRKRLCCVLTELRSQRYQGRCEREEFF